MTFPKFLMSDSADGRVFIIHLHDPRFVAEVITQGEDFSMKPVFFDTASGEQEELRDRMTQLLIDMGDFYASELNRRDQS